ncbi:MBL fold metallo-hydrolase [Candidatus Hydrogenedentota bacterium]
MSSSQVRVTALVEERADGGKGLKGEHGLSFFIEVDGQTGLFDTGQTHLILRNARTLGIDLRSLSWIVLSHGHYDHTGGLLHVLSRCDGVRIFAHPAAFGQRYARKDNEKPRPTGMTVPQIELERKGVEIRCSTEPSKISECVLTTGEVPRLTDFELGEPTFFKKQNGQEVHDDVIDDQSLILKTDSGLLVLCGCAHSGVINTLRRVAALTDKGPLRGVVGGMHLGKASDERIRRTINDFKGFDVEMAGLAHCTGRKAEAAFAAEFGERVFACPVGTTIEL